MGFQISEGNRSAIPLDGNSYSVTSILLCAQKRMIFEKCMEKLRRNVFPVFVFDLFLNFVIKYIFKILRAQIWVTLFHLQQILKQIF